MMHLLFISINIRLLLIIYRYYERACEDAGTPVTIDYNNLGQLQGQILSCRMSTLKLFVLAVLSALVAEFFSPSLTNHKANIPVVISILFRFFMILHQMSLVIHSFQCIYYFLTDRFQPTNVIGSRKSISQPAR